MYASISATFSLSATIIYRPTTFQTSYFSTSFVSFLKEHPRFYVQYNPDLVTINIVYNPDLGWYAKMPLRVDTLDRLLWRVVTVFDREIAQALAVLQVAVIVLGRPFVLFEYSARARPEPDPSHFFELFGVFELEVFESGLCPTWPEPIKPESERKARGYLQLAINNMQSPSPPEPARARKSQARSAPTGYPPL